MNKYKRLTSDTGFARNLPINEELYDRLYELENAIENGTLIFNTVGAEEYQNMKEDKTINKEVRESSRPRELKLKKNYNVSVDDNGASFLIVINKDTSERFVVGAFNTLGEAWKHIEWMYQIESQEFTVGRKGMPVTEWIHWMKKAGLLD